MIVFNKDMFEYCKKVKGLTNKAIARLAKVDERTVGKIKKHAALNPDTAEKIALALNKSIEEMTSPIPDDIPKVARNIKRDQELTALAYGVSPEFITRNAHLFFAHFATEFFLARSKKVKEAERTLGELFSNINNNGQPFDPEYLDELSYQFEDIKYHIECEKSAIEWKDLRGPKINKDQNDLFVDWVANEMIGLSDTGDLPPDENLKIEDIEDRFLGPEAMFNGVDRLLEPPSDYDGEKVYNEIFDIYQPKNLEKAKEIMDYGFDPTDLAILPSEIPLTLRKPENYTKMLSWILAEGQRRSKEKNDE